MSERKVLSKYYPPDFDPSALQRRRNKNKPAGPAVQVVRLMAPMSMRCMRCGEYIYKGRKFNARKETPDEKYLGVQIFRFYIRCTRCSGEIIFKTDPKNQDYAVVSGAKRNVEPWRQTVEETDEQRLDRLEAEAAAEAGDGIAEQNRMEELEAKTLEAKREMDVADALDEIRTRNARIARADHRDHLEAVALARPLGEEERLRQQDREDEEAARAAFAAAGRLASGEVEVEAEAEEDNDNSDGDSSSAQPAWLQNGAAPPAKAAPTSGSSSSSSSGGGGGGGGASTPATVPQTEPLTAPADAAAGIPVPSFKRQVKKKKDHASLLGIKKKPSLV